MKQPLRDAGAFLQYVQGECAFAGVKFRLEARKRTRAGDLGYFDEEKRVLFVCACQDNWPMLLAHELSHLHQDREGLFRVEGDYTPIFEAWCAGKRRLPAGKLRSLIRAIQRCELDAERRTLRLAKTFHLTDDLAKYVQGANAYVWKHEIARRLGYWPKDEAVLNAVLPSMPTKLMAQSQIGKPPPILESLI